MLTRDGVPSDFEAPVATARELAAADAPPAFPNRAIIASSLTVAEQPSGATFDAYGG